MSEQKFGACKSVLIDKSAGFIQCVLSPFFL